jgi:GNAT superfamily N-acetyltransferase
MKTIQTGCTFRKATAGDIPRILSFIHEIAQYEKMDDQVSADEATLTEELFVKKAAFCSFILENGKEVGYLLYFFNFSTFKGHRGLYLEDLFIEEPYRHKGYGRQAFKYLATIAKDEDCQRFEWVCLNWNQSAIDFYHSLGAKEQKEWLLFRLDASGIAKLAD